MQRVKNDKGFTLLEIVISIAVLAIVCVFALRMFASSLNMGRKATDLDMALLECQTAIEHYKAFGSFDADRYKTSDAAGADEGFLLRMGFDEDWNAAAGQENRVFTLTVTASEPDENGVTRLTAEVIRHKPYLLEPQGDVVIYTLEASSFAA